MARPKRLKYLGAKGPRRGDSFGGVPARDLTEEDMAALDDATVANIMGYPDNGLGPLYVDPEGKITVKPNPTDRELLRPKEAAPAASPAPVVAVVAEESKPEPAKTKP